MDDLYFTRLALIARLKGAIRGAIDGLIEPQDEQVYGITIFTTEENQLQYEISIGQRSKVSMIRRYVYLPMEVGEYYKPTSGVVDKLIKAHREQILARTGSTPSGATG